jgi:hypothetical protein
MEAVPMPKIISVIAKEDHTLAITLNNHHQIIYDMRPRLQTVRFNELAVSRARTYRLIFYLRIRYLLFSYYCNFTA